MRRMPGLMTVPGAPGGAGYAILVPGRWKTFMRRRSVPMSHFPLRIDIKAAQRDRDWDTILRYGQDTDAVELFGGFWLFDHFMPINGHIEGPCMDGWTLLGALAAATRRTRLGLMVGCNGYRHP